MATPKGQKLIVLDNNAATQQTIQDGLNNGFAIQFIVNLAPVFNKLLIVYAEPPDNPV
jgi:hypothetical protein